MENDIVETVNGEWFMLGCEESDPGCLHRIEDLYDLVREIGFLPLFSNKIPGFSVEEHVPASCWWAGDASSDPWEWRQIASRHPDIAYGKFFERKAGFISREWFPAFANVRRDGYDFDALYEDGLASGRAKKIMDVLALDDLAVGKALLTFELKEAAGFVKRKDGSGEKNFDGVLTDLQMRSYLIMGDFRQKLNRRGEAYGWYIAVMETPETKWGYDAVTACYREKPEESGRRILAQIQKYYPEADEKLLKKLIG